MKSIRNELMLIAVLLLGLFLRIYGLGNESIWLDEAASIKWSSLNLPQVINWSVRDTHPPLYHIILHYWVNLFGDSEFSARFPSVIFGSIAIFMIYKIGNLIFDKETGILSSLILGLSVFHIYYSQEARMYSLLSLLTLLSMYFFIRLLRERSLIVSIGYILSCIWLMYTHIYGLFIIIAQNIYIFTQFLLLSKGNHNLNLKRWILLQLVLIVLFVPWIMILIKQILRVQSGLRVGWIPVPSMDSIIQSFKLFSGSNLLLPLFLILSSLSLVTFRNGGGVNRKDMFGPSEGNQPNIPLSDANRIYLLLVWLLTPIILPFIISKVSAPIYWYKYTIGASLALYLLVAKGIIYGNNNYIKFPIIGIVVVFSLVRVWEHYTEVNKYQWREVANYMDTNAQPGDLILFNASFGQIPFDYYFKRTDLIKQPFPQKTKNVDQENIKQLRPTAENYNRVWVILAHSGDDKGLIKKTLSQSYNLSYYKRYIHTNYASDKKQAGIELQLFEKK